MVSEAIASGDINAINYFVAEKYVDALKSIGNAQNSKMVLLPIEATGIIGALGGITELVNNVKNKSN